MILVCSFLIIYLLYKQDFHKKGEQKNTMIFLFTLILRHFNCLVNNFFLLIDRLFMRLGNT